LISNFSKKLKTWVTEKNQITTTYRFNQTIVERLLQTWIEPQLLLSRLFLRFITMVLKQSKTWISNIQP
jgi:hypothetical protein